MQQASCESCEFYLSTMVLPLVERLLAIYSGSILYNSNEGLYEMGFA